MEFELSKNNLYYHDPILSMDPFSRFLIKAITIFTNIILIIGAMLLIIGKLDNTKLLGILILLIIAHFLLNKNKPNKKFDAIFFRKINKGNSFNLFDYVNNNFKKEMRLGVERAISSGGDLKLIILDHLFLQKKFKSILLKLDINPDEFRILLKQEVLKSKKNIKDLSKKEIISIAENLVIMAFSFYEKDFISENELFLSIFFAKDTALSKLMNHFQFDFNDVRSAIIFARFKKQFINLKRVPLTLSSFSSPLQAGSGRIMNRAWTARPTPKLDAVSIDLTNRAKLEQIGFMIGHENERKQLLNILSRPSRNNAILIGEPGSGKETIILHLAYNLTRDAVPPELFDKRLVQLSISQLVAGGSPEEILERTKNIINEILIAKNIILYIPDFDNLTKSSGENYLSVADAIIPNLNRGDFQVVASTTPQDFKKDIEPKKDLSATFEKIEVNEISEDEATDVLSYISLILENQYQVNISFRAIKRSVKISKRYFREKLLPSSAEDLLKEALAHIRNSGDNDFNEEDVVSVAQMKINVPLSTTQEKEAEKLLNLEDLIHKNLIDQEEAVRSVSQAIREYRAGLSRKGGPIATFLFAGPTGVGKTELSKILTKIQFGSSENMVRFDMSEYQDKKSIFRFIGSPDGEVGGTLTEAIRKKPFSLILLDEFEKAHPDLLNMFLGVFDDGRLTDNLGRVIDFTNTIIIATSNAHSDLIKQRIEEGASVKKISEELKNRLTDYFRPELINRFSKVIAFQPLLPEHISQITILMLNGLSNDLEKEQGILLKFDDSALNQLVEIGYSPVYGARPMRNAISDNIKSILADKILRKEISRGDIVAIRFDGNNFIAEKSSEE